MKNQKSGFTGCHSCKKIYQFSTLYHRGKLRYQGVAYPPSSSPTIFPNKLRVAVRMGNTNVLLATTWIC